MEERLICGSCGEIGTLVSHQQNGTAVHSVVCNRDGRFCCKTAYHPTEEAAIKRWEKLHED